MNLDLNRVENPAEYQLNYQYKKQLSEDYQADLAEGGFETINFGETWKDRALDHAFTNRFKSIQRYESADIHYSDHKIILVDLLVHIPKKEPRNYIVKRYEKNSS